MWWYQFLNIFFFVFHTALTLFNISGWAFKKTRVLNLFTLLLTAFSWFVLGIWYGWGYCVCTHWHWNVREKLGYHDESNSYIHFLILKLTGVNLDPNLVDWVVLVIFLISLTMTVTLNIRENRNRNRKRKRKRG
jgi:hypothetical protein